jgi:uncharacterized repeat protein (TIGR03943 family)
VSQEQTRSLLLVVLGAMAVWLWRSGQALNYVRPGLVPLVGAAGLVLLAGGLLPPLGLLSPGRSGHRSDSSGDQDGHQHQHNHWGRVGWLLLVPVLVVILIQPAALGSYAVSSRTVVPGSGASDYPPLDAPVRGAVPMPMAEFVTRAVRDPGQSLTGVRVRLTGFVAPAEDGDKDGRYRLTRFVIFCCAADAEALQAVIRGDATPRARDQWLEVEGTWQPRPAAPDDPNPQPPVLNADVVRPIAPQRPPYEYSMQFSG